MRPIFISIFLMRTVFLFLLGLLIGKNVYATELSSSSAWLKLLHYQKKGGQYISLVENPDFFITASGRENPQAEYKATVQAFNKTENKQKCDFPARFILLQKKGLVHGTLADCEEYQQFLKDTQPKGVTLLFTNAYMNNPSSLFGHTLFRIDTNRKGTQLLAHGANFGADTGDESGILFALKGLWGGYYGTFGVRPYYDIINLYNNIENRDIWEYQLNLNNEELTLFTAHLWEMRKAKIRYYFANKNCSYILLSMLEAIRPELSLTEKFDWYATPLATLKTVNNESEFILTSTYRPSRQSKLKYRIKQMNKPQKKVLQHFLQSGNIDLNTLNAEERADVLETAYQYVQYRYIEGELELSDYRKQSFNLLKERSKIINQRQYFNELKTGEDPIYAHKSAQISTLFGARNGKAFQELSFKPAYTSLTDDSYGMLKGAEINLLETKLRHYDNPNKYVLDTFNILNIKSLVGTDMLFAPTSYEISTAIQRVFDAVSGKEKTAFLAKAGAGQSYELTPNTLLYILATPNAAYSGGLRDNGYLGLAFKGGIYYNRKQIRLNLSAEHNFTTSTTARGQTYVAEAAYGLTRDVSLYATYKLFHSDYHDDEEISMGIKVGF